MTVWFAMKHLPGVLDAGMKGHLSDKYASTANLVMKKSSKEGSKDLAKALLGWYHGICLLQIQTKFNTSSAEESSKDSAKDPLKDLTKDLIKRLRSRLSARLDPSSYSARDELADRLSLLADELIFASSTSSDHAELARSCVRQASNSISKRKETKIINPGIAQSKPHQIDDSAPWELACLNHHSRLNLEAHSPESVDQEDIKAVKQSCLRFLSSDYSFLPSWDRSRKNMLKEWWDHQVSSIVCCTLIMLREKGGS
jgi:hypothetical protein